MKMMFIALGLSLLLFEAQAISRYTSTSMSCAEVKSKINAEGATIMRWRSLTNSSIQRYGRFVASDAYCPSAEIAEYSSIPSADRKSCSVLECKQYSPDDDNWNFLRRRKF